MALAFDPKPAKRGSLPQLSRVGISYDYWNELHILRYRFQRALKEGQDPVAAVKALLLERPIQTYQERYPQFNK